MNCSSKKNSLQNIDDFMSCFATQLYNDNTFVSIEKPKLKK